MTAHSSPGLLPSPSAAISQAVQAARRHAATISVAVGIAMLLGKWLAYWMTGSHAILSDALESIVHVAATCFALYSLVLASRPPDEKYPYGYGKIGYFSAGFEGALITVAACAILYEATSGLLQPHPLEHLDVGLAIIAAASVVNLILGLWLIRRGERTGSLILVADGKHVLTDSYTSFGVVLGVALVLLTGWYWLDPLIAILVGLNIIWTGTSLVRESFSGLMDRSDRALIQKLVAALEAGRKSGWLDLHNLRAWQAGDRTFVDFHLVVPSDWTVKQLHDAHVQARDLMQSSIGGPVESIIHFDPDEPWRNLGRHAPWTPSSATRLGGLASLDAHTFETTLTTTEKPPVKANVGPFPQ
jgi:cation diffusion facilitator family transporter